MIKFLLAVLLFVVTPKAFADNLSMFKGFAQEADSAFKVGNKNLCFSINKTIIDKFNTNRNKYVKNDHICLIVFDAYSSLAFLDNSQSEREICKLLEGGISLINENPLWVKNYPNKSFIISDFTNLIGTYQDLGELDMASKYNLEMVSFAENHYKFEIISVLLSACALNSRMERFDDSYPLYQRLYTMFDEMDRIQQYKVVCELIHFEFLKGNYAKVTELSFKHEKLISKAKDENKEVKLDIICFGLLRNAREEALSSQGSYSDNVKLTYESACTWTKSNYPLFFPKMCIDYAYWLYGFSDKKQMALSQYELYLDSIEHSQYEVLFDEIYRNIVDAENAIISIVVQRVLTSTTPSDLNNILSKYPRIVSSINNAPQSDLYEDFISVIRIANDKCYGE